MPLQNEQVLQKFRDIVSIVLPEKIRELVINAGSNGGIDLTQLSEKLNQLHNSNTSFQELVESKKLEFPPEKIENIEAHLTELQNSTAQTFLASLDSWNEYMVQRINAISSDPDNNGDNA